MGCGKSTQVYPDGDMNQPSQGTPVNDGETGAYVAESVTDENEDVVHVNSNNNGTVINDVNSKNNRTDMDMSGVIDNLVVPDEEDTFDPEIPSDSPQVVGVIEMTPSSNNANNRRMEPSRSRTSSLPQLSHIDRNGQLQRDDEDPTIVPLKRREKEKEREKKWQEMLPKWDKLVKDQNGLLKKRIRKGIPSSLRGMVWQSLQSASQQRTRMDEWLQAKLREDGVTTVGDVLSSAVKRCVDEWAYSSYTSNTLLSDVAPEDLSSYFSLVRKVACNGDSLVLKDTPRTFPHMARFHGEAAKYDLSEVLRAWTHYMHDVGYCQGLSFITAVLLMYLPPDDSFYALIAMNESERLGVPKDLYRSGFAKLHKMTFVMKHQLTKTDKKFAQRLEDAGFDLSMVLPQWFICSFCYNLPVNIAQRIWDIMFFEGPKILYRAALRLQLNRKKQVMSAANTMDILSIMCIDINKDFTAMQDEDAFIESILDIDISRDEIAKIEKKYVPPNKH